MRSVNGRRVTSVGVSRHPRFGDLIITTSPPVAFDAQTGLARSSSGFHRLGTDLGEVEKDPAVPVGSISIDWLALIPIGDPEPPARTDSIRRAGTMPMPRPG
ncbi:hypothetical protein D1114_22140 [Cereibacter sphaeroides]|uniref:Uncharacterized protein n=2 Tax=Cereibacter sphaeroides TaxID=1063 RepID=A0AAX1UEV5_CERSP|nr:hypothetical protein D1114_22140 [Cereibacter sphaeroides]